MPAGAAVGGAFGGLFALCGLGALVYFFVLRPRRARKHKQLGSPRAPGGGASGFGAEGSPFASPHRAPLVSFAPSPLPAFSLPGGGGEAAGFEMVRSPLSSAEAAASAAMALSPRAAMNPLHAARGGGGGFGGAVAPPPPDGGAHQHWSGAAPAGAPHAAAPVDEWEQVEDDTGDVFWRSRRTGETAWVRPGSGAWERIVDEEGDMFWHHTETGESSWLRPPGATAAWEKVTDHEGDVWWVHAETGGTSWHDPHAGEWELVCGPVGQTWYRNTATNAVAWEKPPSAGGVQGWQRVVDPEGDVFFRNEATGALSWVQPAGPPPVASPRAQGGDGSGSAPAAQRPITRWMRRDDERTGTTSYQSVDTGEVRLALPPSGVLVPGGGAIV